GADVIVQPPGSSVIGQISGAPVSIKVADVLRKLPHVAVVAPVVSQLNTSGAVELIYGIDLQSYQALGGNFRFLAGGPFSGPNDVIIDDFIATSQHRQVGQSMQVLNHNFRICCISIYQAMATEVMERTREIGSLKSMGASTLYIVNVVLRETAVLAVVGILLGIGISLLAENALTRRFPTVRVEVSAHWVMNACLIAMIGALLGALYPAFKAAQKDPIDALAYA